MKHLYGYLQLREDLLRAPLQMQQISVLFSHPRLDEGGCTIILYTLHRELVDLLGAITFFIAVTVKLATNSGHLAQAPWQFGLVVSALMRA